MKKEQSFPTIIGLVLLIVSLFGGVYLTNQKQGTVTKASGECAPDNLQVTNTTHQSAAVSFITSSACLASIAIDNRTVEDTRFQVTGSNPLPTKIHYFQIFNLKQSTEYDFTIISNGKNYSGLDYSLVTASKPPGEIPQSNLAWGKIISSDQSPANNVILYLNIPGASPLSSYVTSQGNWNISLAYSYNETKENWFQPPPDGIDEDIVVVGDDGSITQVTNSTNRNNPVPDITLGQNYLPDLPENSQSSGQIPSTNQSVTEKSLDIFNPKNGETLNTSKPQFFGSAPVESEVIITVESEETFNGQVVSTSSGDWSWSLPGNLTPGEHTVTVKTKNAVTGAWDTVQRKFYVMAASGDNLAFSATPSATLAPTAVPTLSPTAIPTIIPTLAPTITSMPTSEPVRVSHPSTDSGIPTTGTSLPTIIIGLFAVISFIIARRFI